MIDLQELKDLLGKASPGMAFFEERNEKLKNLLRANASELISKAEERDQIYEELQKLKEAMNEYEISEEPDLRDKDAMVKYITGKVPKRGECPYCHQKGLCRSCLKRHVYIHRNLTGG